MDFKKGFNVLVPKLFSVRPKSEFGEQPQPKTRKILIVRMIFSRLLCSFLMSAIYSFLKYLCYKQTQRSRQAVVMFNIYNSGLARLCAIHFLTLLHPSWVLIHTLGTTGPDQLTNHCV